jgi:hypothetical protein
MGGDGLLRTHKRERKVDRMVPAKINGTGGLCSTCNNAPHCYYRARRGPALFCELFDNYVPPVARTSRVQVPSSADSSTALRAAEEEEAPKYTGLCMNCRHRATCGHPRLTGGVWHCEDYE